MSKPVQFQEWSESLDVPYGPYRAVVERVVDGDTVHVVASLGTDVATALIEAGHATPQPC